MELRHLRYFVGVATESNFRKAAERLHVSQPALSKQVRELEEEVGVRLLDRHSAGARLTPTGKVFLAEILKALAQVDHAVQAARETSLGTNQTLAIGHVGFLASGFMPNALGLFRRKYPAIEIKLHEMRFSQQTTALLEGTINIGLTAAPDRELSKRLARTTILRTRLCLALGRTHPLARVRRVSLKELRRERILCFRDHKRSSGHVERIRQILKQAGVPHRPIQVVEEYESMIALIAAGNGITIIPPLSAALKSRGVLLKPIDADISTLGFELRAIWLKETESPQIKYFLKILQIVGERDRPL